MKAEEDAGLTLVEMMVTLAIISIMTGIAILGIGAANRTATVQVEAQRLAGRLRLAADEVLVTRRVLAFSSDTGSYGFVTLDADGRTWKPDAVKLLGERHRAPGSMHFIHPQQAPTVIAPDGLGQPIQIRIFDPKTSWTVDFDGLNVTAHPTAVAL